MTRDDIIRMARESDATVFLAPYYIAALERFAEFVAAQEREACKQACEELRGTVSMFATSKDCRTHNNAITCCVQAISARGDT